MPSALKISFFDAFGNPTDKTYEKNNITAVTTVSNPTENDSSAKLIVAFYADGVLTDAAYENVQIPKSGTAFSVLTKSVPEDADSLRAYVWTDTLMPLAAVSEITVRPSYDKSADE